MSQTSDSVVSSPAIVDAPSVSGGQVLYEGDANHSLYALNATTGAIICSFQTPGVINSSPVVAPDPDGTGPVVYFGDNGPDGDYSEGGHVWAVNGVGNSNGQCTQKWVFGQFGNPPAANPGAGAWSSPAYALNADGTPVVVIGSADPDEAMYAFNAVTGAVIWRFQYPIGYDFDIGASPTIGVPGDNGIADGAVYDEGKDSWVEALDFTTGALLWNHYLRDIGGVAPSQSGPALDGNTLYEGDGTGMFAYNATTGAIVWQNKLTGAVYSCPGITGPSGDQIIFAGDFDGHLLAFDAADGDTLYSDLTSGFIYSSPAIVNNMVYMDSDNGYLYALKE